MPAYNKPGNYSGGPRRYAMNILMALVTQYITKTMQDRSFLELDSKKPTAVIMRAVQSLPGESSTLYIEIFVLNTFR